MWFILELYYIQPKVFKAGVGSEVEFTKKTLRLEASPYNVPAQRILLLYGRCNLFDQIRPFNIKVWRDGKSA